MTSGSIPQQAAGVKENLTERFTCKATFGNNEMRVVVEQPARAVEARRYNSAQRQCLLHMVASPPNSFECETSGNISAPRTELTLQQDVLEKMPLLQDISQNTSPSTDAHADLELPCSVWGLVSLLLLLEGSVKLAHWFGGDCDPSLPSQTLLAADFMACKGVRKAIIEYLQNLFINTMEQSDKQVAASADAVWSQAVHQAYAREWRNTQVLRELPGNFTAEVFCKLTDRAGTFVNGFQQALSLPQDLLSRWVASTGPVLDLRDAELTALQWSRLFISLVQEQTELTELHVRAVPAAVAGTPGTLHFLQQLQTYVTPQKGQSLSNKPCSVCPTMRSHGYGNSASSHGNAVVALCTRYSICGHIIGSGVEIPLPMAAEQLHSTAQVSTTECSQVLNTLAGVLPQLHSLKHVGLHNLQVQPQLMPALGQVLLDLPPSVTTLTLSALPQAFSPPLSAAQRGMLFNAIALVRGLRELHMPDWEDLVGLDGEFMEPLRRLHHLEAIYVREDFLYGAFPAGLPFKAIPVASEADDVTAPSS